MTTLKNEGENELWNSYSKKTKIYLCFIFGKIWSYFVCRKDNIRIGGLDGEIFYLYIESLLIDILAHCCVQWALYVSLLKISVQRWYLLVPKSLLPDSSEYISISVWLVLNVHNFLLPNLSFFSLLMCPLLIFQKKNWKIWIGNICRQMQAHVRFYTLVVEVYSASYFSVTGELLEPGAEPKAGRPCPPAPVSPLLPNEMY